ncbi:hypothetical protein L0F63_006356 [Massospora cicadina]|nr:hypothetical protein L0F63_006356 [Massospora cicadina]
MLIVGYGMVKSSKHAYSTDTKGAQLVKLSLRCGATMRAILSANLGQITTRDVDELNLYFSTEERNPILKTIQFNGLTFLETADVSLALWFHALASGSETVRALVKGISRSPFLEWVSITRCDLCDKDLGPLLTAVAQNPKTTTLILDQNAFSGQGCEALTKGTGKLRALGLSANYFGFEASQYVARLLQANLELRELDLSRNQLRANGINSLAPAFLFNHALVSINLSGNEINSASCARLCECLEENWGLRHLNLAFNHIGDRGVEALCGVLDTNTTLQSVQLDMNRLSSESGRILGNMLKKNTSLGILAFARELPSNSVLQRLILTRTRVQDAVVYNELASALEGNRYLKPLLARNYLLHQNEIRAAVRVLWGVRALFSSNTWGCPLPPEILEKIVISFRCPSQPRLQPRLRSIFRFGRCLKTLSPEVTLEVFLTHVFGEHFRLQPNSWHLPFWEAPQDPLP